MVVTRIAQGDAGTLLNAKSLDLSLVDIESDGHGEKVSVGQTHVSQATIVVGLIHETLERGEATVDDEFEIAQLTLGEDEVGKRVGFDEELGCDGSIADEEVLEDSAVGCVGHVCGLEVVGGGGWVVVVEEEEEDGQEESRSSMLERDLLKMKSRDGECVTFKKKPLLSEQLPMSKHWSGKGTVRVFRSTFLALPSQSDQIVQKRGG